VEVTRVTIENHKRGSYYNQALRQRVDRIDRRLHIYIEGHWPRSTETPGWEREDHLYFAEGQWGDVHFFFYDKPGRGFGGQIFTVTMKDGSKVQLKGPFSSRNGVMNWQGFTPSVEVYVHEPSYITPMVCHLTVRKARRLLREWGYGHWDFVPIIKHGIEPVWELQGGNKLSFPGGGDDQAGAVFA